MKSAWGTSPGLPRGVLDAVLARAQELGREVASDDLFLLALAGLAEGEAARCALAQEGIDPGILLSEIRVSGDQPAELGPV